MRSALRTRAARKAAALLVAAPLLLAPYAAAGPAEALPKQAAPNTVEALVESKFAPETLTVPVGTEVTWLNKGGTHTVTGGDGALDPASPIGDQPLSNEGETIKKTFDKPGSYPFFCTPHISLGMKGVIVVTEAAAGAASSPAASGSAPAGSASAAASSAGASVGPSGSNSVSGSNAASASAGAAAGASSSAPAAGGSASAGTPDATLGASALEVLDEKLASETKPLTSFRLALWVLTLSVALLGAGIYFVTKPRRDEE